MDYDASTGELIPKSDISEEAREITLDTIADLGLNKPDVRNYRLDWTRRFTEDWQSLPTGDRHAFAEYYTRRGVEFAGVTLMIVQQLLASEGT